jgi:hypothetical protein
VERVPKTGPKGAVFCRLFTGTETYRVKNVPVNYAFWFSGPVTALTARRVRYGVGAPSICQADLASRKTLPLESCAATTMPESSKPFSLTA